MNCRRADCNRQDGTRDETTRDETTRDETTRDETPNLRENSTSAVAEGAGETRASTAGPTSAVEAQLPEPFYLSPEREPGRPPRALQTRFADLQPWQCRSELRRQRISVTGPRMAASGVATPVRIAGPLGKVRWVTPPAKSVYGIVDCRLVLLLAALEPVLLKWSVREVYVDNFYRPRAHLPGKTSPSQHAFGLAIDIDGFKLEGGTVLRVERDFHGRIGEKTCQSDAYLVPPSREAVWLRNIVCDLSRLDVFAYVLTPNHDEAHRNHLHLDIKRGARQTVVR